MHSLLSVSWEFYYQAPYKKVEKIIKILSWDNLPLDILLALIASTPFNNISLY